jgi:hypothetical protein
MAFFSFGFFVLNVAHLFPSKYVPSIHDGSCLLLSWIYETSFWILVTVPELQLQLRNH